MSKLIDINALNKNNNYIKTLINNEIIERSSMIYKNNDNTYITTETESDLYLSADNQIDLSSHGNQMYLSYDVVIRGHDADYDGDGDVYIESQSNNVYINAYSELHTTSQDDMYIKSNNSMNINTEYELHITADDMYITATNCMEINSAYEVDITVRELLESLVLTSNKGSILLKAGVGFNDPNPSINLTSRNEIELESTNDNIYIKLPGMSSFTTLKHYIQGVVNGTY